MPQKIFFSVLFLAVVAAAGCGTKVIRTDTDTITDLSGGWNDTDARLVAEEMVRECLSGNWTNEFNKTTGRSPVVIVGTVRNRSMEHINSQVFINDLEQALINSGKVQFVVGKDFRDEIRVERADQLKGDTEPSTISERGHETGADFMLQGEINAIQDSIKGKYAMLYQVTLQLIDLKTNQKRWIGKKEIKKVVLRPSVGL